MQKVPIITLLLFIALTSFSPSPYVHKEKINWISFEQAEKMLKTDPRPILVDVYTDWCGWCKVMDKKTYANNNVADYINKYYYAIKFNAESKTSVLWRGKTYQYEAQYRMHGLAVELLKGDAGFPTTVFIPVNPAEPQPIPGFLEPKDIHTLLTYFSESHHQKVRFDKYAEKFKSSW
jgi:thioredoxin-related protein